MRWEQLFTDLEGQLEAEQRAVVDGDVADLVRAERARLTLPDRLRAHVGEQLTWSMGAGETSVTGELLDVGVDWVLLRARRGEMLIPLAAVHYVTGLSRAATPSTGEVARRLGLTVLLRGLSRDRAAVRVRLRSGEEMTGTIDRVGADHLDLAVHAADLPRRSEAVREVRCLLLPVITGVTVG